MSNKYISKLITRYSFKLWVLWIYFKNNAMYQYKYYENILYSKFNEFLPKNENSLSNRQKGGWEIEPVETPGVIVPRQLSVDISDIPDGTDK